VLDARHYGVRTGVASDVRNARIIDGDHASVGDLHFCNALPHSDNERGAGEKSKRLPGESDGREARRNYYQRPHPPPEIARLDARVTPINIDCNPSGCELFEPIERLGLELCGSATETGKTRGKMRFSW
jgi:hypothetical protein